MGQKQIAFSSGLTSSCVEKIEGCLEQINSPTEERLGASVTGRRSLLWDILIWEQLIVIDLASPGCTLRKR